MIGHAATAYTYARTFDGPRLGGWLCTCGAGQTDLLHQRAATKAARAHEAAQGVPAL